MRSMRIFLISVLLGCGLSGLAPAQEQKTYGTPRQAAEAMIGACLANDRAKLLEILGPEAQDLFNDADPQAQREQLKTIGLAGTDRSNFEEGKDGKVIWLVGEEVWPFPIPLVHDGSFWRFDTPAGKDEILARRIGTDELEALKMLSRLARAQEDYASQDYDGDQVLEFAQRVVATEGTRDGLYWVSVEQPSPLQSTAEEFKDYLVGKTVGSGWYGYHLKPLNGQTENAAGGRYDYVINGNLIGGYSFVAWPIAYGNSGIMTFIVNHNGKFYERDLGEDTEARVREMTKFDPAKGWTEVDSVGNPVGPVLKRPGK
ncbi:DUF2950 family protein [bacterium CPR1]|nr:DUF2950 family protein [bacterium CPR1]